jgi:tetratricopeptide (TPR) repeat protein
MVLNFKRAQKILISVLFIFLVTRGIALADIIKLKSGKEIEGKIEEEWESFITVNMGSSMITIQRDTITTIVKSLYSESVIQQAREALENGKRLLNEGKRIEARRFYEMEILKLEQILSAYPNVSDNIRSAKTLLEKARRETIPPDPKSQEIEDLYQKALNALDRVRYEEAFQLLKQVGRLSPDRPEILLKLGLVASQLNQFDEAIKAFQQVLEIDPNNYYGEVSPRLLDLLDKRGRQLLAENKNGEALGCYKIYLLLRSESPQRPVDLKTFRDRYETCRKQSEEETLMKVFQFADEQDLTDLALAAIKRVQEIKPGDSEVRQMTAETEFLREFKDVLHKGNYARAVRLKGETAPMVLQSERVSKKIGRIIQEIQPEARAQFTFLEAMNIFQKGRYEDSRNLFQRYLKEFPDAPQVPEATEDLKKAEFEIPIEKAIRMIRETLDAGNIEQADKEIRTLLGREGIDKSLQWNGVQECSGTLEKEKKAREIWKQIQTKFKTRSFEIVLERLDNLEQNFSGTFTGKKAIRYLKENRGKIEQKIEEQKIIGSEIFIDLRDPAAGKEIGKFSPEQIKMARLRFEKVMEKDIPIREMGTMPFILWTLALVTGFLLSIILIFRWIPPGKETLKKPMAIQEWEMGFVQKGEEIIFENPQCRFCGLSLKEGAETCDYCGASIKIHEEELSRHRFNNFYGAGVEIREDLSLREKELEEHFRVAEELADAGNTKASFKMALMAYHDDPSQMKCLELLTGLYEKMKKPEEAHLCYHRMLMLDPTSQEAAHKIENFKSVLSSVPIRATSLISALSFAFWWMVFWAAVGFDPWGWAFLPRMGLAFFGFALTSVLWNYQLKKSFIRPEERFGSSLGHYHPISQSNLRWRDLNRQAEIVHNLIFEHTGVRVPKLTTGSLFLWISLSILFLCALVLGGWLNRFPAILLSWVGGITLLFFLMEIYPRVATAHVLLRHFYEEIQSSWADPEIPFKTHRLEACEDGEFNMKYPGPLPVSWALNPAPYKATRQGFLNSILQTLNRHAGFHHFYRNLKIENPFKMAMPPGFLRMKRFTLSVIIFSVIASLVLFYYKRDQSMNYRMNMQIGYQYLLEDRIESAPDYFFNARQEDSRGFAPDLYLGMAYAKRGIHRLANKYYSSAAVKGAEIATAHEQYAEYLRMQGRMNEAIREYKQALELETNNADILNNIGMAYFNMSNYPYSITYLTQSIVSDPGNGRAYTVLGLAYEESGERGKSRESFKKAIQASPQASFVKLARNRLEREGSPDIQIPQ